MTCRNHPCHLDQAIAKFWVGHYNEDLARIRKGGIDFPEGKVDLTGHDSPVIRQHAGWLAAGWLPAGCLLAACWLARPTDY